MHVDAGGANAYDGVAVRTRVGGLGLSEGATCGDEPGANALTWYLLLTQAQKENRVYDRLCGLGFGSYLPLLVQRCRRYGKRVRQVLPLFPQYVFVSLNVGAQDLHEARIVRGVLGVVKFGGDYAIVPGRVIHELKGRENPQGVHVRRDLEITLRKDMPVRIGDGPFEGMEGIFLQECGRDRVWVLINIIGKATRVSIDEAWIEPLHTRAARFSDEMG